MCAVEKTAFHIQPGAESHVFPFDRAGGFGGDEVADDGDFLPDHARQRSGCF